MTDLNTITAAKTADDALRLSGELGHDAYSVRLAYIRLVFGPRATGGYFNATDRNVAGKFVDAWRHERAAARVRDTPELAGSADFIFADWPEGTGHLEWVATAPVAEIAEWVAAGTA